MASSESLNKHKSYVLDKTISRVRPVKQKAQNFFKNRITKKQRKSLKYDQFVPLYQLWCQYYSSLLKLAVIPDERLLKADYHGCLFMVSDASNPSQIGLSGIVVMETRHTFQIITRKNKLLIIPKQGSSFQFIFEGQVFTLFGDAFKFSSAQRIKKMAKSRGVLPYFLR